MRPTASGAVLQSVRPNILIILTDDQSTDELSAMPRTTAWFQEGSTVFDRGYVTTPLRCPSRSTIFSGRYIHNHGNTQNDHPFNLDQSATFQRYLQDAGYTTALTASSSPNGRTRRTLPTSTASRSRRAAITASTSARTTGGYKNPAAYSTTYLTQKALEDIDVFGGRSARRPTSTSRRTTSRGTSRSASIDLVKTPGRTRTSSRMGTPRTTRTSRRSGRRSQGMRNALARSVRERGGAERGLYGPDSPNPASRSTAPGSPACPSAGSPKSFSIVQRRS